MKKQHEETESSNEEETFNDCNIAFPPPIINYYFLDF
jgi:hypothetical protein